MAFGSIMFAFGGASTFPTIQADMKDKSKFKFSAYIAMAGKTPIVLRKHGYVIRKYWFKSGFVNYISFTFSPTSNLFSHCFRRLLFPWRLCPGQHDNQYERWDNENNS